MSNYTYEPVSPRSQGFSESSFSSPCSMYTGSVRTASTHSSYSDEEEAAVLRVVAPQAKRPISGPHDIPHHSNAIGFTDVDYLQHALKLDSYDQQVRGGGALEELLDLYHSNLAVTAQGPMHPCARAAKVDSIGEEDELELIDEQPRYTREHKGKSVELSDSEQSPSSSPLISSTNSSLFGEAPSLPSSGLSREDIVFRMANLNQEPPSRQAAQAVLAKSFPSLVEPPARMFGEDGTPLPPTKKEEISAAERLARQQALKVELKGNKVHSVIKAIVVLESRTALWKKVANIDKDAFDLTPLALLPELPNPWDLEILHEGLDISTIKSKTRKIFELPRSKTAGACHKCSGLGSENCRTCRGEAGNECFWCSGTGMQKGSRRCGRCQGQGKLSCMTCEGKKASTCRSCDGAGCGEYSAFVEVKMRRIEVPAVSVANLLGSSRSSAANARPEMVKTASVDMLWELVKMLAAKASSKTKRPYLPASANAKFKAGSKTPFRPEGLYRTIPTKTRYFSLPTDPSLPCAELTLDQFVRQNVPEKAVVEVGSSVGVHNVSRRLSVMLLGEVSAPSIPQLCSCGSSPKSSNDYFSDVAGAAGAVVSVPVTPKGGSPISSPLLRPSSARPMSPMRAPPASFNLDELRIKMLRHSSTLSRSNFSRPITAPGIPI